MSLRRMFRRSRSPLLVRCALLALFVFALLAAARGHARAQACSALSLELQMEILLPDGDGGFIEASEQDITEFFNLAHCACDEEFAVKIHMVNASGTVPSEEVELWVGPSCDAAIDLETRVSQCELLSVYEDVETFRSPQTVTIPSGSLMFPNSPICDFDELTRTVYALIDDDNDNDNNFQCVFSVDVFVDTKAPPDPVEPVASPAEGAVFVEWEPPVENQDDIEHHQFLCERVDGEDMGDGFPSDDPEYETSNMLCGLSDGTGLSYSWSAPPPARLNDGGVDGDGGVDDDAGTMDAGPTADAGPPPDARPPAEGFESLDPAFICGTAAGTETSKRIEGLENGVAYRVAMLVVDEAGNATAVDLGIIEPSEVTDFWEDYHARGGGADGGICLVNSTYGGNHFFTNVLRSFRDGTLARYGFGRALIDWYYAHVAPLALYVEGNPVLRVIAGIILLPFVAFAAFWIYTGVLLKLLFALALAVMWRRRRQRKGNQRPRRIRVLAAATTVAVLLAWSASASAQGFDPYWDQFDALEDSAEHLGPEHVEWNVELKLGPYYPEVDSEFDLAAGEAGPFETVFRDKKALMGIVELQRFFLFPAGQLGATASIGFMGRSANSFKTDADGGPVVDPTTGEYERAPGDKTRFRMIPSSLGAVYRFTELDDRYGVPLVPYGKIGLSYYLWWVRRPDGSLASVPTDDTCVEDCATDRALGASIGWQASIGLSLRAERIDKQAGFNLRNEMNIEHAGFFAELTYASVNHFGSDDRLNVGDLTWFAGINFEF